MHVGFIGTGSMGSILIESFLRAKVLRPNQLVIYNRTPSKAVRLAEKHPGVTVAANNAEVARKSDWLFLCVKPLEYQQAITQCENQLSDRHVLVTITSPVRLAELEATVPCPVMRAVPSITNAARSGLTLIEFGSRISEEQKQSAYSLFSQISHPVEIQEKFLRISSDISSCGPAFLSYVLQQMIAEAVEETGISRDAATFLTTQMVIGFADLLQQEVFSLPALQERVCVPGGVTGEGLIALRDGIPGVFGQVFRRTHAKFAEDRELMSKHLFPESSETT
ncbi:late competence protein ComER [Brevibacillus humidisoli]|uniref:late competence protein ComER n=1 Tax=Brevibacillus humidisoli TaxID=2895522 RepID=UPI001E4AE832|nr:late competence protein ComER [Brevibacillus humidisoli]UFJ38890.1 late competence protein ComER [Brevibacillus humidisoli]